MEDRTLTKHYFISGRVQGVGYRAFAEQAALEMKLQGWVRNLSDGRVEVVVSGLKFAVENYVEILKRGPKRGQVEKVVEGPVPAEELAADFEIREDGP